MGLYKQLKKHLKEEQSPQRFLHSVSVGDYAAELGKRYGWDPNMARLAGLLHDYAKEWSPKRLLAYVNARKLKVPSLEFVLKENPNIMHGYVSADIVRRRGWLTDKKALKAISSHTLGAPRMSKEDKILLIADSASADRPHKWAEEIRKSAKESLQKGYCEAITAKVYYQLRKRKALHPLVIKVWNKTVCPIK